MSNHNIRYDEEFKNDAVNLILEKHRSVHSVAKDLGVSEPTLRRWLKEKTKGPEAKISEAEVKVKKLEKELDEAKETIEILKKSVSIFINPRKK
jgi:transposase